MQTPGNEAGVLCACSCVNQRRGHRPRSSPASLESLINILHQMCGRTDLETFPGAGNHRMIMAGSQLQAAILPGVTNATKTGGAISKMLGTAGVIHRVSMMMLPEETSRHECRHHRIIRTTSTRVMGGTTAIVTSSNSREAMIAAGSRRMTGHQRKGKSTIPGSSRLGRGGMMGEDLMVMHHPGRITSRLDTGR